MRAIDPLLQYQLPFNGGDQDLLEKRGVFVAQPGGASSGLATIAAVNNVSMSEPRTLLLAMSAGAVAKHIYWILYLNQEHFPPSFAVKFSAFNLLFGNAASLLLLSAKMSSALKGPQINIPGTNVSLPLPVLLRTVMFITRVSTETIAEVRRKQFKDRLENKATGGL